MTEEYFKYCNLLMETRGLRAMIKYAKSTRLIVTRYLSGNPLDSYEGVKIKGSWPAWLAGWKPYIAEKEVIRYLFTLLTAYRGIELKPILDTSPITKEWGGSLPFTTGRCHRQILKWLGVSRNKCEWSKFHLTTKSGPNGQALLTSLVDLSALPPSLYDDITIIGGSPLKSIMDKLKDPIYKEMNYCQIWNTLMSIKGDKIRKLSYFSDKEGKTRVIGILDYWSQTALRPLHNYLNSCLKGIEQDGTFNQNSFLSVMSKCEGPFHSLDLTNATDRMPKVLQKRILRTIFGFAKTEAWDRILTFWPYPNRDAPSGSVNYKTGQPMGAYSSWPIMALTHHYIVKLAGLKAGIPDFKQYVLLGDDIVIANDRVAMEYRKLLSTLDMPISEAKTHVSRDTYEFAKRWVHQGEEVTGFSISGLIESWKKYPLLHNFLENQAHHGWKLSFDRHPELIRSIYRCFRKPQQAVRVVKLYTVFDALIEIKRTKAFNTTAYKALVQCFGMPETDDATARALVEQCLKHVRVQMLNSDLETYQTDVAGILKEIQEKYVTMFPGLDTPAYRQFTRDYSPIIMTVNDRIDSSFELIMLAYNPDVTVDELYSMEGLAKYSVSRRIFTMRTSHAQQLNTGRMVKAFISEVKVRVEGGYTHQIELDPF